MALAIGAGALQVDRTKQNDDIQMQLMRIRQAQDEQGIRLSGNKEFHDWLMENSRGEMPQRLEGLFGKLNKQNMKRRLFDIYKWQVGR